MLNSWFLVPLEMHTQNRCFIQPLSAAWKCLDPFEYEPSASGDINFYLVAGGISILEFQGLENGVILKNSMASESSLVRIENEAVGAGRNIDGVVGE